MNWTTTAAIASAIGTVVNAVVVIVLARYNRKNLDETHKLVKNAEEQSRAAMAQADASKQTLQLVLAERSETLAYQKATFQQQTHLIRTALTDWSNIIHNGFHTMNSPSLLPGHWDMYRAYVAKVASDFSIQIHALETKLRSLEEAIETRVRNPHYGKPLVSTEQDVLLLRLKAQSEELETLIGGVLAKG